MFAKVVRVLGVSAAVLGATSVVPMASPRAAAQTPGATLIKPAIGVPVVLPNTPHHLRGGDGIPDTPGVRTWGQDVPKGFGGGGTGIPIKESSGGFGGGSSGFGGTLGTGKPSSAPTQWVGGNIGVR